MTTMEQRTKGTMEADRTRGWDVGSLYAGRVGHLKGSAVRDLMGALSNPELVSLAGGFPDTGALGGGVLGEISGHVARRSAEALQYGPTGGLEDAKGAVVEVMAAEGVRACRENVFITTGAQQALDLVGKAFLDEGDVVICEAPTYVGALNAFSSYGPNVGHVPMDEDGMDTEKLHEVLEEADGTETRVKLIYTIPNFQNPSGATLTRERRREMLRLAREFGVLIVEDNPYGMLRFEGESSPALAAMEQEETGEPERVVYLGTFSKVFAPGLRVGWIHAGPDVLKAVNVGKQGADLCSSNLSQMMIAAYFEAYDWRENLERLKDVYRGRRDAMLAALGEFMPEGVSWSKPEGGFFVWVELPEIVDATRMLEGALNKNVAYVPGEGSYANGKGKHRMRLSFSFVDPGTIRRAIESLAVVIREELGEELVSRPAAPKMNLRPPDYPPKDWQVLANRDPEEPRGGSGAFTRTAADNPSTTEARMDEGE